MKLYTEEQVRKIFETLSNNTGYDYSMEDYIFHESLLPIELPSDEEIEKAAIKIVNEHCDSPSGDLTVEVECFEAGVYWMKEQILNQNK